MNQYIHNTFTGNLNDRSTTTCRLVNLHVGVANCVIQNNVQIANATNKHNQYSKEGCLQGGDRKQRQLLRTLWFEHAPLLLKLFQFSQNLATSFFVVYTAIF